MIRPRVAILARDPHVQIRMLRGGFVGARWRGRGECCIALVDEAELLLADRKIELLPGRVRYIPSARPAPDVA